MFWLQIECEKIAIFVHQLDVVFYTNKFSQVHLPRQQERGKADVDKYFRFLVDYTVLYFEISNQLGSLKQNIAPIVQKQSEQTRLMTPVGSGGRN